MSRHSILSNTQREAILTAQFDLEEREVARYWTWSDQIKTCSVLTAAAAIPTASDSLCNSACFVSPAGHRMGPHYPHWLLLLAAI
jgi:hypothetical protein